MEYYVRGLRFSFLGMARGHQETLKHVEKFDGYSVLIRALQSPVEKLQIKSAFLLSALCNRDNDDHLKATLIKMGIIEQAAGLLAMGNLLFETKYSFITFSMNLKAFKTQKKFVSWNRIVTFESFSSRN